MGVAVVIVSLVHGTASAQTDPAPPPLPDLTISSPMGAELEAHVGDVIPIRFVVENTGSAPARATNVAFYAGGSAFPRFSAPVPSLQPGMAVPGELGWDTINLTPGIYNVGLFVDENRAVSESNEMNNAVMAGRVRLEPAVLSIVPTRLPNAQVGAPYGANLAAPPADDPDFRVISGALPSGFTMNAQGLVEGVSEARGDHCFMVSATAVGFVGTQSEVCVLVSEQPTAPLQIDTTPPTVMCSRRPYRHTFAATGGRAPYTWSVVPPLPPGTQFKASGQLFGVPIGVGAREVAVQVRDSAGTMLQQTFRFVAIHCQVAITAPLSVELVVRVDARIPLTAMGDAPPYAWSLTSLLPDGLRLDRDAIVGRPTRVGEHRVGVTVRAAGGTWASGELQITIVRASDGGVSLDSGLLDAGGGHDADPGADLRTEPSGGPRRPGLETVDGQGCTCEAAVGTGRSSVFWAIVLVVLWTGRQSKLRAST